MMIAKGSYSRGEDDVDGERVMDFKAIMDKAEQVWLKTSKLYSEGRISWFDMTALCNEAERIIRECDENLYG